MKPINTVQIALFALVFVLGIKDALAGRAAVYNKPITAGTEKTGTSVDSTSILPCP